MPSITIQGTPQLFTTFLDQANPTATNNINQNVQLRAGSGIIKRGVFLFDLNALPNDALITYAKIKFRNTAGHSGSGAFNNIYIRRITELGTNDFANWNTYNGINSWFTLGGDFTTSNEILIDSVRPFAETGPGTINSDTLITSFYYPVLLDQIEGARADPSNKYYTLWMYQDEASAKNLNIASSVHNTVDWRPSLYIEYVFPNQILFENEFFSATDSVYIDQNNQNTNFHNQKILCARPQQFQLGIAYGIMKFDLSSLKIDRRDPVLLRFRAFQHVQSTTQNDWLSRLSLIRSSDADWVGSEATWLEKNSGTGWSGSPGPALVANIEIDWVPEAPLIPTVFNATQVIDISEFVDIALNYFNGQLHIRNAIAVVPAHALMSYEFQHIAEGITPAFSFPLHIMYTKYEDIQLENTSTDLFVKAGDSQLNSTDLFIQGTEVNSENNERDLFTTGIDVINNSQTLFIEGSGLFICAGTLSSDLFNPDHFAAHTFGLCQSEHRTLNLFCEARLPAPQRLHLFTLGPFFNFNITELFIRGGIDTLLDLFIGAQPANNIPLFIKSALEDNRILFIRGAVLDNQSLDLFIQGEDILPNTVPLFISGTGEEVQIFNDIPLFLNVSPKPINNRDLFIKGCGFLGGSAQHIEMSDENTSFDNWILISTLYSAKQDAINDDSNSEYILGPNSNIVGPGGPTTQAFEIDTVSGIGATDVISKVIITSKARPHITTDSNSAIYRQGFLINSNIYYGDDHSISLPDLPPPGGFVLPVSTDEFLENPDTNSPWVSSDFSNLEVILEQEGLENEDRVRVTHLFLTIELEEAECGIIRVVSIPLIINGTDILNTFHNIPLFINVGDTYMVFNNMDLFISGGFDPVFSDMPLFTDSEEGILEAIKTLSIKGVF